MPEAHDHIHPPTMEFRADVGPEIGSDGRPIWHIMMDRVTHGGESPATAADEDSVDDYWAGYKWSVTIKEMPDFCLLVDDLFEGKEKGIQAIVDAEGEDVHIHCGVNTPPTHRVGADLLDRLADEVNNASRRFDGAYRALSHHLVDQLDITAVDAAFLMGGEGPEIANDVVEAREAWYEYALPEDDQDAMQSRLAGVVGSDPDALDEAVAELVQFFFYAVIVAHPSVLSLLEPMNAVFDDSDAGKYLMLFVAGRPLVDE